MMRTFSHVNVAVLDGGLPAWTQEYPHTLVRPGLCVF